MALTLLAMLPLHYLWRLSDVPSPWPRRFLTAVGRIAGLRVTVAGTPLGRDVLFLANHLSWLDILLIAGTSGASFVSKAEVRRWPVVGWLASLHGTVYVARAERSAVRGQVGALRAALASGRAMALFPEGTTDGGGEVLLPFRPSLLAALYPPIPGIAVQPVAIDYGAAGPDIAWIGEESARSNVRRVLGRRDPIPVTVRFLDPIDPAAAGDRKALATTAHATVSAALPPSAPRATGL